jgi:hypothetical protein
VIAMRVPVLLAVLALTVAACSPSTPAEDTGRRAWRGPAGNVSSAGITTYERREIAQKVSFPTCLTVDNASFRFAEVRPLPTGDPVPAGLLDTGYGLDRWRLLAAAGALAEQDTVFVSVRGSTGVLGVYPRQSADSPCRP